MRPRAKDAHSHQKLEEASKDSPLEPLEGARPWWHLDFRLLASGTEWRESISIVQRHHVGSNLLWQPQETNTNYTCIWSFTLTTTLRGRYEHPGFPGEERRADSSYEGHPSWHSQEQELVIAFLPSVKQFQTRGKDTLQYSKRDGQNTA